MLSKESFSGGLYGNFRRPMVFTIWALFYYNDLACKAGRRLLQ
jgi:hypothetical protein